MGRASLHQRLIFRRMITGDRCLIVLELDHDVARARLPLWRFMVSAAHEKLGSVLVKHRTVVGDVVALVAVEIVHVDPGNPVTFGHSTSPCCQAFACMISATMAFAAAFGSDASMTGRPT